MALLESQSAKRKKEGQRVSQIILQNVLGFLKQVPLPERVRGIPRGWKEGGSSCSEMNM